MGLAAAGLATLAACADGAARADGPLPERAEPARGGASANSPAEASEAAGKRADDAETPKVKEPEIYTYEIIKRYPHDRGAYTQGLLWHGGQLYESTGQRGESTVRLVELETGKVIKRRAISPRLFGEGLAVVNGLFYQLTWKAGQALLFDAKTLRPLSYGYSYAGEGWGLTTSPAGELVMSDGTDVIRFLDPKGMKPKRRIEVRDLGRKVVELNELEWINGEIWANVWKSNSIARIDPETGEVKAWVDLNGILGDARMAQPEEEVLNGIAWDEEGQRLFVTGKRWPFLYHIELRPKK